jgi:hypothetical protein
MVNIYPLAYHPIPSVDLNFSVMLGIAVANMDISSAMMKMAKPKPNVRVFSFALDMTCSSETSCPAFFLRSEMWFSSGKSFALELSLALKKSCCTEDRRKMTGLATEAGRHLWSTI